MSFKKPQNSENQIENHSENSKVRLENVSISQNLETANRENKNVKSLDNSQNSQKTNSEKTNSENSTESVNLAQNLIQKENHSENSTDKNSEDKNSEDKNSEDKNAKNSNKKEGKVDLKDLLENISKENKNKKPNNFNKQILLNVLSLLVMLVILGLFLGGNNNIGKTEQTQTKNSFSGLLTLIRQGKVSEIELLENKTKFAVKIYDLSENEQKEIDNNPKLIQENPDKYRNRDKVKTEIFPSVDSGFGSSPLETIKIGLGSDSNVKIGTANGEVIYKQRDMSWYGSLLNSDWFSTFVLITVTAVIGIILVRKLTDANNRSISFGNTRSKFYDENNKKKVTFADVAGNEEAKTELLEVVDFLKRPIEYNKMGAKIPKGVLLVGSPGNGKTLMARAIAGEAEVPFMYVSGSEFVEMFVGVGASRVRDLFKQAKAKSPCVIFIDEIDAVGRQRGAGVGGGNDEREQTLNQILVELDGFDATDHVILIGATNRPDVLDPALLRPGRFDRQVTVTSPDRKEREAILKIHAKGKNFAPDVDLSIIAKRTAGFSGADLMNVLNESAILAVREKAPQITNLHVREGVEKAILGSSLVSKVITEEQKKLTAYHEAGHAIIQTILPGCNKVQKITIIPRGRAAGYTFAADGENDAITRKKSQFIADITSLFGGYVAEEIIFGEVSTGGSNDLEKATQIARNMATRYGMTGLGPISFEEGKGMSFLGKDMMDKPNYSDDSARKIDLEVATILKKCYSDCHQILADNIVDLHRLAQFLIEKEVIEYEEFVQIVGHLLPKTKTA